MFVDQVKITAKAGNGGNGAVSFHREKFVQKGGPDGGDGGNGGGIVLLADPNMHTLMDFRYKRKYTADNGENGAAALCRGKSAKDLIIKVPVGTTVRLVSDGRLVADMHEAGQEHILLKGGRGGWGNAHFATPTRQAPNFAKPGQKCEITEFELELKSIADVGLVGYPNVGKSTILSVVTAARPKIANYHFTTLAPNLGICRQYGTDFVMADIPGLVEGASDGVGLGIRFLRHVERTRLLVHVVDIAGSAEENLERLKKHLKGTDIEVYPVSAATQQGFDALMGAIVRILPTLPERRVFEEELPVETAEQAPFTIEKDGSASNILVLQSPDKLLADEARRVIASSPAGAWTPGEQRGEKVRVKYTLPVDFYLQGSGDKLSERPEKPQGSLDGILVVGYGATQK